MHDCCRLARRTAGALLISLGALGVSAAGATEINAHAPLVLHGGPGESFPVRSRIEPGRAISVLWCNGDATWCLVRYGDGQQGWAPISSLKATPSPPKDKAGAPAGASPVDGTPEKIPAASPQAETVAPSGNPSSNAGGGGATDSPVAINVGGGGGSVSTPAASISVKTP
jgi:uncharacterized protein YgiM (DUF1202 family)